MLREGEHAWQFVTSSSVPRFVAWPAETELLLLRPPLFPQLLLLLLTYSLLARAHSLPLPPLLLLLLAHLLLAQSPQLRGFEPPPLLLMQVLYLRRVALNERGLRQTIFVV